MYLDGIRSLLPNPSRPTPLPYPPNFAKSAHSIIKMVLFLPNVGGLNANVLSVLKSPVLTHHDITTNYLVKQTGCEGFDGEL